MAPVDRVDGDHRGEPAKNSEACVVAEGNDGATDPLGHQLDHCRRDRAPKARAQHGKTNLPQENDGEVGVMVIQNNGQANTTIPPVAASSTGLRPIRSDSAPIGATSSSNTAIEIVLMSSAVDCAR